MPYTLVVVDTTQIQPYIFASNRLAENIGASWLVSQATGPWALGLVNRVAPRNNLQNGSPSARRIEDGNLDAEVIYAAGGNVLVLFDTEARAREFIRRLSRRVLCEAPGLTLLFASQQFDWSKPDLFRAVQDAFSDLERQKSQRAFDAPLPGLGVTAACQSTGLPASAIYTYASDAHQSLSAGIVAKLEASSDSNNGLKSIFSLPDEYDFPRDFDHLGRSKGEQSLIAVAHVDGNGFGQAMIRIGEQCQTNNRLYIDKMRARSMKLEQAAREAMQAMLKALVGVVQCGRGNLRFIGEDAERDDVLRLRREKGAGKWHLPFRPLVFGGDDTTFVCDGRLGLWLTTFYLAAFARSAKEILGSAGLLQEGELPSACAGVAIVKSRYPFARAYSLAEALSAEAKRFRARQPEAKQGCFLDWHLAFSGLIGSLSDIRRREYQTPAGSLTLRPVSLEPLSNGAPFDADNARSWPVIESLIDAFQGQAWASRRNKVKALREALREGSQAVKQFSLVYRLGQNGLPELARGDAGAHRNEGWLNSTATGDQRCAYFDAIELIDLHLSQAARTPKQPCAGGQGGS